MRRLALLSILVFAACGGSPTLIVPELPDDIDYIGALSYEDDRLVASSGLMPRQERGTELDVYGEPSGRFVLVGYRESDLATRFAESPRTDALLSVAAPTDPVLPAPSFLAGWPTSDAPPTERELTAEWLRRCPDVFDPNQSYYGDLSCAARRCGMEFRQNADCTFAINTGACLSGVLEGVVDGRGGMSFSSSGPLAECRRVEARPFAATSIECVLEEAPCTLDAIPSPATPLLDAEALRIYDVTPERDQALNSPPLGSHLGGWAFLAQGQVVLSGFGGDSRPRGRGACPRPELHFVDLASLTVVRTATSAPCLDALASTPEGTSFFAVTGTPTAIFELDVEGRVLRTRTLPEPAPRRPGDRADVVLRAIADRAHVYIAFAESLEVFAVDRSSLDLAWTAQLPARPLAVESGDLDAGTPQFGVVLDSDDVQLLDRATGRLADLRSINFACRIGSVSLSASEIDSRRNRRLITTFDAPNAAQNPELLIAALDADACDRLSFYEAPADSFSTATLEDGRVVTGLIEPDTQHTYFALADPETARFLPGSIRVDEGGVPWRMRATPRGVYALLPASAQLVRITLR